jgi:hypothetical protein
MTATVVFRDHLKHLFSARANEGPRLDFGIDAAWLAYGARSWSESRWREPAQNAIKVNDSLKFVSSTDEYDAAGDVRAIEMTDPITQVLVRHSVDIKLATLIERLRTERDGILSLSEVERRKLFIAGVLVDTSAIPTDLEPCARHLLSHGFARVRRVVGPLQIIAMQQYIAALIKLKMVSMGDGQVSNRYTHHNDPQLQHLHHALAIFLSRLAGKSMKPSYRYLSVYTTGSELATHVDREQCEMTISILVDYIPNAGGVAGWPLFLRRNTGTVGIFQEIGEALIFRGRDIPHYRERIQAGHRCTVILLHYVNASFSGILN